MPLGEDWDPRISAVRNVAAALRLEKRVGREFKVATRHCDVWMFLIFHFAVYRYGSPATYI